MKQLREKVSINCEYQTLTLAVLESSKLRSQNAKQGRIDESSQIYEVLEGLGKLEHIFHGASDYEAKDFGLVDASKSIVAGAGIH